MPPTISSSDFALLCEVIHAVARSSRLPPEDAEDFAQAAHLKLLERNYAPLTEFSGRSSLRTYLTVVVQRLLLDWRNARYGRWRPSARSRRLGPDAVDLDRLMSRDGHSAGEAVAILSATSASPPATLEALAARIDVRCRPRTVSHEEIGDVAAAPFDDPVLAEEDALQRLEALKRIRRTCRTFSVEDRRLLHLRFVRNLPVVAIAEQLHTAPRLLYRRIFRLVTTLRRALNGTPQGTPPATVPPPPLPGAPPARRTPRSTAGRVVAATCLAVLLVGTSWTPLAPAGDLRAAARSNVVSAVARDRLSIRLYDNVHTSPKERAQAMAVASAIFNAAAIEIDWTDCPLPILERIPTACGTPLGPDQLMLRVTNPSTREHFLNGQEMLGQSMLNANTGTGTVALVFRDRIARLAASADVEPGVVLGRALAHEIGHLLLGAEHRPTGIMRAQWTARALRHTDAADWMFLPDQGRQIQQAQGVPPFLAAGVSPCQEPVPAQHTLASPIAPSIADARANRTTAATLAARKPSIRR